MKRPTAPTRLRPQPPVLQLRVWRVFEYRHPLPIRRPRFTT